jgi:hypothetical protein
MRHENLMPSMIEAHKKWMPARCLNLIFDNFLENVKLEKAKKVSKSDNIHS